MLSVIIPTLNAERTLPQTLGCLVQPTVQGLVRDVVITDGGSSDATALIADETGARFVTGPKGRGGQLRLGAAAARGAWFLFLHADTVLEPGWAGEAQAFMDSCERLGGAAMERAAVFRFALDDFSGAARRIEWLTALRGRVLGLPYGDQGLLLHRSFYAALGGHPDVPLMEDVALAKAIGRRRLVQLRTAAVTSAVRYRRDGFTLRPLRNLACLSLYAAGVSPRFIARLYE